MMKMTRTIGPRGMRKLPKILIHEHLDCSLRPRTMLELWDEIGFETAKLPFPKKVLMHWQAAQALKQGKHSRKNTALIAQLEGEAVRAYRNYLVRFASASLANYVQAIVDHVLPLMQTSLNLYRITQERIEDAVNDGIVGMELRFAPQLHTMGGLSLEQVMETVIEAVDDSPVPVDLTVCALRHENGDMARKLADLCLKYEKHVGCFDLAADEAANPGVLDWWLTEALKLREARKNRPVKLKVHLWETNEPTEDDVRKLDEHGIDIVGHGVRGDQQDGRVLEVCPTSNVVTGQVSSILDHPIDRLYREGKRVTVNTDGTLFTRVDLTEEYRKLQRAFGWELGDFYRVNLTALEAANFGAAVKADLRARLARAYLGS